VHASTVLGEVHTTPTPLQRRAFELLDVTHRHGLA